MMMRKTKRLSTDRVFSVAYPAKYSAPRQLTGSGGRSSSFALVDVKSAASSGSRRSSSPGLAPKHIAKRPERFAPLAWPLGVGSGIGAALGPSQLPEPW